MNLATRTSNTTEEAVEGLTRKVRVIAESEKDYMVEIIDLKTIFSSIRRAEKRQESKLY